MKMLTLTIVLLSASAFANTASVITDKVWSCSFNDQKSAIILANYLRLHPKSVQKENSDDAGMHLTELKSISVTFKDGKIVGGEATASGPFNDDTWDFSKIIAARTTPEKQDSPHDTSYNDTSLTDPKMKKDKIEFGFGYDSYDHFNYTIDLDPRTKTAVVHDAFTIDCLGDSEGLGVLDCSSSDIEQ